MSVEHVVGLKCFLKSRACGGFSKARNREELWPIRARMSNTTFLRMLIELSSCEKIDALLDGAARLLEHQLGLRGHIEVWDSDGVRRVRGSAISLRTAYRVWIGLHYTIGAIYVQSYPADATAVELLAAQLAPLAERLLEADAAECRSIREDIDRIYERRIRSALVRFDWNASAVARALSVSRNRVARVARRCRRR